MIVGYNVPRAIFIEKVKRDRKEIAKRSLVWYGKNVVLNLIIFLFVKGLLV